MITIDVIGVEGFGPALYGMRNPMNSWSKSDTAFDFGEHYYNVDPIVGPNDHELAMKLVDGGPVHAKFRRMIHVWANINAPLYWWKEFDTYKVGTVANSCSTMHKVMVKPFELDDFSHDRMNAVSISVLRNTINCLNLFRRDYLEMTDGPEKKDTWYNVIQLLPTSYNQLRTVDLNYEVLSSMYHYRKDHKLDEWHKFCDWIEKLPYHEFITGEDDNK